MQIEPIAYIETDFKEKFGIPRQSLRVESLGRIVFYPKYRDREALRGIEAFSHLWLLFDFSLAHREGFSPTVRPPRLGGNTRVGVFASRSPYRPNSIGLSSVKFVRVDKNEQDGDYIVVKGADLLDGTPIYDIKPYIPHSDCHPDAVGSYADVHRHHALSVNYPPALLSRLPEDKREVAIACLAEDPRPSYQNDPDRIYRMRFSDFEIVFRVENAELTVTDTYPV
ncbi:MAG: tRNA (N6-threonylcarbamoyladenosine(37)-N6)-methyltransferase TrmO [Clostridia bacterium]|nr:tRNA (N6-threonylcarbamoyladenosine(37)-N6)-methyltransferase TrmO [Clostridia bacterium]